MSLPLLAEPVRTSRRAHQRYEVTIPVDCSTLDVFVSGQVSNISRGGLFIRSEKPLPLSAEVTLVLQLTATGRCIRASGRVVWNFDIQKGTSRIVPGSGIRFVDMSEGDREALGDYLERLARPVAS
jgi:type IV pilus assembly protein PilZ